MVITLTRARKEPDFTFVAIFTDFVVSFSVEITTTISAHALSRYLLSETNFKTC